MPLTVSDLLGEIRLASGAQNSRSEISDMSIITQALEYFNSMSPWRSMVRPEVSLSLTANQDYIALPVDTRDVLALHYDQGLINWFKWTDPSRLTEFRAADDDDQDFSGGYYGAVEFREPVTGGRPVMAVSLYPKPATTQPNVFRLRYRAKLMPKGTGSNPDTQYLYIMDELAPLVRRLVRIYAEAYYHRDGSDLEMRLEALEQSSFLMRLKDMDGALQPEMGVLEGGAADTVRLDTGWWDNSVADPA